MKADFKRDMFSKYYQRLLYFLRSANGKLGFCIITEPVLTLKSGEREQLISLALKTTF